VTDNSERPAPGGPDDAQLNQVAGDEESLGMLRLAISIAILFLLLYFVADRAIRDQASIALHLALILGAGIFMVLAWTRAFRRFWRLWSFSFCVFLMAMFIAISAITRDPVSRLIAIILCPFATASFMSWSSRWQLAMSAAALFLFILGQALVPLHDGFDTYRWLGVLAAIALSESTSIFVEQYRTRIRHQLRALEEAARFREREIATMAHDIRNPVSALAGYVELLEEPSTTPAEREQMIARIGSTAWNTNLVVSNALDLYRMEEDGKIRVEPAEIDPNPVLAEVAEDCAAQARRVGMKWRCRLDPLPRARIDAQHLARIVRNLAAVPLAASHGSQISLSAVVRNERIAIEINAPGAEITPADLNQMMANPRSGGRPPSAGKVGLFLARAMTEAAGGTLTVRASETNGLYLVAELPCSKASPPRSIQAA